MSPSISDAVAEHVKRLSETTSFIGEMETESTVGFVFDTVMETEALSPKSVPSFVVVTHCISSSTEKGPGRTSDD